jgi:hypothetical protein
VGARVASNCLSIKLKVMAVKLGDAGELLWWQQRSKFISVIKKLGYSSGVLSDLLGLKHSNERRGKFAARLYAPKLCSHLRIVISAGQQVASMSYSCSKNYYSVVL